MLPLCAGKDLCKTAGADFLRKGKVADRFLGNFLGKWGVLSL